nr:uncharacterized protein LOC109731018 isoform X1 [Microcebus murinus]
MGPRGRGGATRHVTRFPRAAGVVGEGRVGKGAGPSGREERLDEQQVGGRRRRRGRLRERARLANFQCSTALAAVRARVADATPTWAGPMVARKPSRPLGSPLSFPNARDRCLTGAHLRGHVLEIPATPTSVNRGHLGPQNAADTLNCYP